MRNFFLLLLLVTGLTAQAATLDDAMAAYHDREYRDALPLLETAAKSEPENRDVLFALAVTRFRTSDYKGADAAIDKLLEMNPKDVEVEYLRGIVNIAQVGIVSIFRKMGVAKAALASWQKAAELDPTHAPSVYSVFAYYATAPGIVGGDLEKAKSMLDDLSSLSPGFGELARAAVANREERFDEAEAHFKKAVELMPDNSTPPFYLAQFYYQRERFQDAITWLDRFDAAPHKWEDPDRGTILYFRGTALVKLGDREAGRENLNLALAEDPNDRMKDMIRDEIKKL
ncbi:MAG: tetratricopeptide repeat protein [Pseudomonadales bacterium]|nr:tetratricopeptide repeat protein [Pseudomonadales bacterium]